MTISSYLIYRKIRSRLRSIFNNLFKQPENVDVDIQKIIQYIIQKDEIKNVLQMLIGLDDEEEADDKSECWQLEEVIAVQEVIENGVFSAENRLNKSR